MSMIIHWNAVITGSVVTIVLGIITGLISSGTNVMIFSSWGMIGVLGGLAAGGTVSEGAFHGGLAAIFGSLLLLLAATGTSVLFTGVVPAIGLLTLGILMLVIHAIPGVFGGAIGSWTKGRQAVPEAIGTRV